jgi:hypothetical protein
MLKCSARCTISDASDWDDSRSWHYNAVAHLVEALRRKPEDREFDLQWVHWDPSLTQSFRLRNGPWVDSASTRNEYQGSSLRIKAAGA